ncbi:MULTISPECIES: hypothetical protein [unclassified Endozoicomonas]|uniref:hypothetical protein n=1 Tax=unclassified Endozoicomonas TaxID=2644528 RepID=UPI00214966E8|nr:MULTISPECIES: hypothetical protein [unclassified Endozoicomonas]
MIHGLKMELVEMSREEFDSYPHCEILNENGAKCIAVEGGATHYLVAIDSIAHFGQVLSIEVDECSNQDPDGGYSWLSGKIQLLVRSLTGTESFF